MTQVSLEHLLHMNYYKWRIHDYHSKHRNAVTSSAEMHPKH